MQNAVTVILRNESCCTNEFVKKIDIEVLRIANSEVTITVITLLNAMLY